MRVHGHELTYPRVVLLAVLLVTLTTLAVAVGTSSAAYGSYNYDWDGTSDVRSVAADAGADVDIVRAEAGYRRADADSATAFVLEPTSAYSESESAAVASFLDRGGTVVVAAEGDGEGNRLLAALGVESRFDGRSLRDEQRFYRSPALPIGSPVSETAATSGVSGVTLNHGTVVNASESGTALVNSSAFSYLDANANGEVRADPSRLQQLVENLVRNAVEHGGDDVTVTIGETDDGDGFYIADDGTGIPETMRAQVFQNGFSTIADGTGFGLAIVKEIADAHGWTMEVTESQSGGARFEITGVERR